MSSDCSANKICRIILIIFIILIIIAGVGIGAFYLIKFLNKKNEKEEENEEDIPNEPFIITEKHRQRISLLQECMNTYGIEEILELIDGTPNSEKISNNKILSISTFKLIKIKEKQ